MAMSGTTAVKKAILESRLTQTVGGVSSNIYGGETANDVARILIRGMTIPKNNIVIDSFQ